MRDYLFLALTGLSEDLVIDTFGYYGDYSEREVAVLVGYRSRMIAREKTRVLVDEQGPVTASLTRVGLMPAFAVRATVEEAMLLTTRLATADQNEQGTRLPASTDLPVMGSDRAETGIEGTQMP